MAGLHDFERETPSYATKRANLFGLPGEFLGVTWFLIIVLDTFVGALWAIALSLAIAYSLRTVLNWAGADDGAIRYASRWLVTHRVVRRWLPDVHRAFVRSNRRAGQTPLVASGETLQR